MFDFSNFTFYVPDHMWGKTFKSVFPNLDPEQIIDLPIGDPLIQDGTGKIIRENLIIAREMFKKTQKIPIIILPITSVYEYTSINDTKEDPKIPLVKIIGPSFKTRDDIFLFLYKHKNRKHDTVKIYPKGEDLTTTRIGRLYNQIVLTNGVDPLWHQSDVKNINWGYSLKFEKCYLHNNRLECYNNPDYYGFIAAGIELKNLWDEKDWISAINLNSWLCHFLKVNYFPRTFFVSISDSFSTMENVKKIRQFWEEYIIISRKWLQNKKHQNGVHGLYYGDKLALPIQKPSISDIDFDHFFQLAEDLNAIKKFLHLTKEETYRDFDFFDIFIMDDFLAYELYKLNENEKLSKKILDIIKVDRTVNSSEKDTYTEIINNFLKIKLDFKDRNKILNSVLTDYLNNCLQEKQKKSITENILKIDFQKIIDTVKKYLIL